MKNFFRLAFYFLPLIVFLLMPREPEAAVASAPAQPMEFQPLKVTINKIPEEQLSSPSHVPAPLPISGGSRSPLATSHSPLPLDRPAIREVKAYIRTKAMESGVDPQLALWIAKHESSFNPRAQGDGEASRGLWQISKIYHPEISDEVAFGVESSTDWSMQLLRAGKANEWSAYRYCKTLYGDCPF